MFTWVTFQGREEFESFCTDFNLGEGKFPSCWKKANIVTVHKKEDKTLLKIYKPISLLSIFGRIFERILFKYLFNYFHKNQVFT